MSSGDDQSLHLSFGPNIMYGTDIQMYSWDITERLKQITTIESHWWEFWKYTELNVVGETYYQGTWNITNNMETRAKILALKKMIDYDDGEQFKTLFNIWSQGYDFHVIDVSGLDGIYDQSGVLDLAIQPEWNMHNVLGLGVLQMRDAITGSSRLFCPYEVCFALCHVLSQMTPLSPVF